MKNKLFLALAGSLTLLPASARPRPNVIYVFPDQMRGSALGFIGDPAYSGFFRTSGDPVRTPNLDAFALESAVLTNAFSSCPVSSPHRGSLLTGMHPHLSGVPINCRSDRPYSMLREDVTCIGDVFHEAGYDCAYIGKYHVEAPTRNDPQRPGEYVDRKMPAWDAYTPAERRHGFDFWYSYGTFDVHKNPHYWDSDGVRHDPHEWSPVHEAKVASEYILSRKGRPGRRKPFFMMVSMNPPHSPYNSLKDCESRDFEWYRGKSISSLLVRPNADTTMAKASCAPYYFASVTGVDRAFGMILDALREAGLEKNTIVIFASDHGETMCSHGLDDAKNSFYTEATGIPFIVRYPGKVRPGVDDVLLSTTDIMPTVLGLAGLHDAIPGTVQGTDLSGVFFGSAPAVRPDAALYIKNNDGRFRCGSVDIPYFPAARGLKTGRYTFCVNITRSGALKEINLFDDILDPYQLDDIADSADPSLVRQLLDRLSELLVQAGDPWAEGNVLKAIGLSGTFKGISKK